MEAQTFKAKLPSGFDFEIKRMLGKHQRWLTQGHGSKKNKAPKTIDDVVIDCLVSLAGVDAPTKEDLLQLPTWDYKKLVLFLRFYTCDRYFVERYDTWKSLQICKIEFDSLSDGDEEREIAEVSVAELQEELDGIEKHNFPFSFEWEVNGSIKKEQQDIELYLWDFTEVNVPIEPIYRILEDFQNDKYVEIELGMSGQTLRWRKLDVKTENDHGVTLTQSKMHLNSPLEMRNPSYMKAKSNGEGFIPLSASLDSMDYLDVEQFRKSVFDTEIVVDTNIGIRHPESGEIIKMNALGVTSFFFPSGVV